MDKQVIAKSRKVCNRLACDRFAPGVVWSGVAEA